MWFKIYTAAVILAISASAYVIVQTMQLKEPPTQEVCTRSHIKKIPVVGLDGKITRVPAERCDEYKIEKTN